MTGEIVFRNGGRRALLTGVFGVLSVVGLIETLSAFTDSGISRVVSVVLSALLTVGAAQVALRVSRSGLFLDAAGVRVVGMWRTRELPWDQVAGFAAQTTRYQRGGVEVGVVDRERRISSVPAFAIAFPTKEREAAAVARLEAARAQLTGRAQ